MYNKVVLGEAYDQYNADLMRIRQEVRYEAKRLEKEMLAERSAEIEADFGRLLASAIDQGLTRAELAEVTRSNDHNRIRKFYDMAGRRAKRAGRPRVVAPTTTQNIQVEDAEERTIRVFQLPEAELVPEGFVVSMDRAGDTWTPALGYLDEKDRDYILAGGKGSIRVRALVDFVISQGW